jgi:O-antigen/teichoic acid export membrane protein
MGIMLGRALVILTGLVAIPVVIDSLGMDGYGAWEAVYAVCLTMGVVQSTMGGVLLWRFSQAFGRGSSEEIQRLVGYGLFVALCISCLTTPTAWIFREQLTALLRIPAEFHSAAVIALPCVVGCMLIGALTEVFAALLCGSQRSGVSNLILSSGNVINNGVVLVALLCGAGFWSLVIGYAVGLSFNLTTAYIVCRRLLGPIRLSPKVPSWEELRHVKGYVGFMLMHGTAVTFRDQLDKLIMAASQSTASTAHFSLASRLAGFVPLICGFVYTPVIAAAGALHSRGDHEGLKRLYWDTTIIVGCLVGLCAVLLVALNDRLMVLWVGHVVQEVPPLLYLLLLGSTTAVLMTGAGTALCKGMGMVRMEGVYIALMLLVNGILKITLVPWLGGMGTVIASVGSWVLGSMVFVFLLRMNLPMVREGMAISARMLLLVLGCALASVWLIPGLPASAGRKQAICSLLVLGPIVALAFGAAVVASGLVSVKSLRAWSRRSMKAVGRG